MTRVFSVRNRQRARRIHSPRLRQMARWLLEELGGPLVEYEVGLHLVDDAEMARVNETYLGHHGSTDVITFDHAEVRQPNSLHGELFVCVDQAVAQARNFGTNWQSELARYLVHGLLHLLGYDDCTPESRRVMKREETRLLRLAEQRFPPTRAGRPAAGRRCPSPPRSSR